MNTKLSKQDIVAALAEMSVQELDEIISAAELFYRERQEHDSHSEWDYFTPVFNYSRDV